MPARAKLRDRGEAYSEQVHETFRESALSYFVNAINVVLFIFESALNPQSTE